MSTYTYLWAMGLLSEPKLESTRLASSFGSFSVQQEVLLVPRFGGVDVSAPQIDRGEPDDETWFQARPRASQRCPPT